MTFRYFIEAEEWYAGLLFRKNTDSTVALNEVYDNETGRWEECGVNLDHSNWPMTEVTPTGLTTLIEEHWSNMTLDQQTYWRSLF